MRTRDIACGLGLGLAIVAAAHAAAVVAVSPQGEVAQVRQVTVKFSDAVVAFGDPRLADPFVLSCQGAAPAGAGRWASDRVWLYDFREPLPPGTKCTAKLRPEWKPAAAASSAAAAVPLGQGRASSASRPAARRSSRCSPATAAEVEEDQHFLLAPRTARRSRPASLANACCEVEGIGERLPLRARRRRACGAQAAEGATDPRRRRREPRASGRAASGRLPTARRLAHRLGQGHRRRGQSRRC